MIRVFKKYSIKFYFYLEEKVMKLKQWLKEYHQMTYAELKTLPEDEAFELREEHKQFCRKEQIHKQQGWRPMTEEENVLPIF